MPIFSNLYSVAEHVRPLHWHSSASTLPSVSFAYEISSMGVRMAEMRSSSVLHAVARLAVLVGGVVAVSRMWVGAMHQAFGWWSKLRAGKQY